MYTAPPATARTTTAAMAIRDGPKPPRRSDKLVGGGRDRDRARSRPLDRGRPGGGTRLDGGFQVLGARGVGHRHPGLAGPLSEVVPKPERGRIVGHQPDSLFGQLKGLRQLAVSRELPGVVQEPADPLPGLPGLHRPLGLGFQSGQLGMARDQRPHPGQRFERAVGPALAHQPLRVGQGGPDLLLLGGLAGRLLVRLLGGAEAALGIDEHRAAERGLPRLLGRLAVAERAGGALAGSGLLGRGPRGRRRLAEPGRLGLLRLPPGLGFGRQPRLPGRLVVKAPGLVVELLRGDRIIAAQRTLGVRFLGLGGRPLRGGIGGWLQRGRRLSGLTHVAAGLLRPGPDVLARRGGLPCGLLIGLLRGGEAGEGVGEGLPAERLGGALLEGLGLPEGRPGELRRPGLLGGSAGGEDDLPDPLGFRLAGLPLGLGLGRHPGLLRRLVVETPGLAEQRPGRGEIATPQRALAAGFLGLGGGPLGSRRRGRLDPAGGLARRARLPARRLGLGPGRLERLRLVLRAGRRALVGLPGLLEAGRRRAEGALADRPFPLGGLRLGLVPDRRRQPGRVGLLGRPPRRLHRPPGLLGSGLGALGVLRGLAELRRRRRRRGGGREAGELVQELEAPGVVGLSLRRLRLG